MASGRRLGDFWDWCKERGDLFAALAIVWAYAEGISEGIETNQAGTATTHREMVEFFEDLDDLNDVWLAQDANEHAEILEAVESRSRVLEGLIVTMRSEHELEIRAIREELDDQTDALELLNQEQAAQIVYLDSAQDGIGETNRLLSGLHLYLGEHVGEHAP